MSILIKGMKMPKGCCDCDLLPKVIDQDEQWECPITEKIVNKYVEEREGKPSDCPLVEIPPHGRLIDADKLCEYARNSTVGIDANDICRFPCVIEAEEQEHE